MSKQTGGLLRYGPTKNEDAAVKIPFPITVGETFRLKSGRFVTKAAGGTAELADDGDTVLLGWMDTPTIADGVSVTGDVGLLIPALSCPVVFRIPIVAGTYVAGMLGQTCDLARVTVAGVTLIQGAKLDGSGEDILTIVDGDLVNNEWVDVMINQIKVNNTTGVV